MYGKFNLIKIDDARFAVFRDKYAPKDEEHPLSKVKRAGAIVLPPSKPVFHKDILRASLVASVWNNADKSMPTEMSPTECGWSLKDHRYRLKWFAGDQIPDSDGRAMDESPEDVDSDGDRYSPVSNESDSEGEIDV